MNCELRTPTNSDTYVGILEFDLKSSNFPRKSFNHNSPSHFHIIDMIWSTLTDNPFRFIREPIFHPKNRMWPSDPLISFQGKRGFPAKKKKWKSPKVNQKRVRNSQFEQATSIYWASSRKSWCFNGKLGDPRTGVTPVWFPQFIIVLTVFVTLPHDHYGSVYQRLQRHQRFPHSNNGHSTVQLLAWRYT